MSKALEIEYELRRIYQDDILIIQAAACLRSQDAEIDRLRELNAELVAALEHASSDINWMLNSRQFLNGFVFDYMDKALAKAKEQS